VGAPLELHEPSLRAIEARLRRFGGIEVGENNRRQAMLPKGAVVFDNPYGTAPGFVAERGGGGFVACMPGVPREMRAMLADRLVPWLTARFGLRGGIVTRTLRVVGVPESELDRRIEDLFRNSENPKIAMLAHGGRVDVKIMARAGDLASAQAMIAPLERELRERIGPGIFGVDGDTLESAIVARLTERGLTLATAESLTGGGVADAIVGVPGASACFLGGVVAYADAAKAAVLGVDAALIAAHGAVSEEVAMAMARGARARFAADVGISTTGIAGPAGATEEKPVGLVWYACATAGETVARSISVPGERADVRARAVNLALNLLWRTVSRDDMKVG
jgi:nicotinamide-nucleotide amidase